MNFLRSIGKKLSEVSDDINQNLSQLKVKASASFDSSLKHIVEDNRPDAQQLHISPAGCLLPGADLLASYQRHWSEIHRGGDAIGQSVDRVGRLAAVVSNRAKSKAAAWSALQREACELPRTLASLECIGALLDSLEQSCREVEHELALLENQAEWGQLRRDQHAHNYQLLEHSRRRSEELERRRVQLAQRHAGRVRALEQSRQAALLERQRAFEQEFQRDMEFFKEHGHTERAPSVSSSGGAGGGGGGSIGSGDQPVAAVAAAVDAADLLPPPPLDDAVEADLDRFLDAPNDDELDNVAEEADVDAEDAVELGDDDDDDDSSPVFPPAAKEDSEVSTIDS